MEEWVASSPPQAGEGRRYRRVSLNCGDELITKQSFADECDINNILDQYKRTGMISHIAKSAPKYLDLPAAADLQEAFEITSRAADAFASLPSLIRDSFDNDPVRFLAALEDPAKREVLEELGVYRKKQPIDSALEKGSPADAVKSASS